MRGSIWLLLALGLPLRGEAQAPETAELWEVVATTLASPPALDGTAAGAFWNPVAIVAAPGLRIGIQATQTPEVLGINGLVAAITQSLGSYLAVGMVYGRIEVGDLVRTTTSPLAAGTIPVYEQVVGLYLGTAVAPVRLAGAVRAHDSRLDLFRESGFTLDLGVEAVPSSWLRVAASTQFVPADFSARSVERYFAGAEFRLATLSAFGAEAQIAARYGATVHERHHVEHHFSTGVAVGSRLTLDVNAIRERPGAAGAWRVVVAVGVRAGRYAVIAARGSGVGDLGANYRVGFEMGFGGSQ